MKKIYFIIGIPGSGKSYWLNQQNTENKIIFDDISQLKDPLLNLEKSLKENYKNIYIADVNFLELKTLKNAEEIIKKYLGNQKYEFKYVVFKSNMEISKHNVMLRNDGRNVEQTIKRFCFSYDMIIDYLKEKNLEIIYSEKYKKIKKKTLIDLIKVFLYIFFKDKNMEKTNKISAEEMKSLIKNIFELSQKVSGNVSIKNLDSAAEFAVNLFGFKNWKEYKHSLNKESNLFNLLESEDNLFLAQNIKFIDKNISNIKKYQFKDNDKKIFSNKESSHFPSEYLIGSHEIKNMKTKQPRGLMSKDAIITSNKNNIYKDFLEKKINWLLDNNQEFIIFSNKEIEKIKFPEKVKKLGKENIKTNPINAIINSDLLDLFFRIEDAPKSFSYLWSFLVKKCNIDGKNLSIDDLINMTTLDKILEIKENFVNDFVLDKMLNNYLNKYIEIKENCIFISKENQEIHYKENCYLINKLKEIKKLYEDGYFSEDGYSLKEAIFKKESCVIYEYNNTIYNELIINEYIQAKFDFIKDKNINENNNLIWVLFLEAEMWLQNYQQELLKEHPSFAQFFFILNNYSHIDGIFKNINQILFLKQSLNYKNSIIKDRMLTLTKIDEVHFWYNNNNILKHLKDKEGVLWRTDNDPFAPSELESFILEKIELY